MARAPDFLQGFIDSNLGQVLANVLHTLGAIGFLAGLFAYLAWYRMLRRGTHQENVLIAAAFTSYLAIIANFVGGFMRNLQAGHPGLTSFSSEPWVRVLFVKHLFLFAASGAAVFLFQWVVPRILRAHKADTLGKRPAMDHAIASSVIALGIVVATVLGAVSQVTPIFFLMDDDGTPPPVHDPGFEGIRWANATGTLTSTPLRPSSSSGTVDVPEGTARLDATLTWSPTEFDLAMQWTDPTGAVAARSDAEGEGRATANVTAPLPGAWSYRITSDLAVDVRWDLTVRLTGANDTVTVLTDTVTIAPGSFFEINTEMEQNASFSWSWQTSEVVHFDVHSHFDGEVQYHVEKETDADEGTFTNEREGGYSLLWANEGSLPVTLEYRVSGAFEVHSYFPPR